MLIFFGVCKQKVKSNNSDIHFFGVGGVPLNRGLIAIIQNNEYPQYSLNKFKLKIGSSLLASYISYFLAWRFQYIHNAVFLQHEAILPATPLPTCTPISDHKRKGDLSLNRVTHLWSPSPPPYPLV